MTGNLTATYPYDALGNLAKLTDSDRILTMTEDVPAIEMTAAWITEEGSRRNGATATALFPFQGTSSDSTGTIWQVFDTLSA